MPTPLAWRNLTENKVRATVATAAICFALVLIFVQLALYELCLTSAVMIFEMWDFDALVISSQYEALAAAGSFPRTRIYQCRALPGVRQASPVCVATAEWRNPDSGQRNPILVIGAAPTDDVFRVPGIRENQWRLAQTCGVLFDSQSQPLYGPHQVGLRAEVGGQAVEVVGEYRHGTGFNSGGGITVSDVTFGLVAPGASAERVQFGLLKWAPGQDPDAMLRALQRALPPDVRVVSRAAIEAHDQNYIVDKKPIGIMFSSGVVLGFFIGAVILYQVLASDILKRLREYATLKALGYSGRQINGIVFEQAFLYALLGYAPALAISAGLYALLHAGTNLPIPMTLGRAALVLVLAVVMCCGSALLGIRKVRSAAPADLFG